MISVGDEKIKEIDFIEKEASQKCEASLVN